MEGVSGGHTLVTGLPLIGLPGGARVVLGPSRTRGGRVDREV